MIFVHVYCKVNFDSKLQLCDDVFYMVGTLHSRFFAICRMVATDALLTAAFVYYWDGWSPTLGSMCSGVNGVRKAHDIWGSALKSELGITYKPTFLWACDTSTKAYTFMTANGERVVFANATQLASVIAQCLAGCGAKTAGVPVEPVQILYAGVECSGVSSKNMMCKENLEMVAEGTSTAETTKALVSFAHNKDMNQELQLIQVENVKNFMGVSSVPVSVYAKLEHDLSTTAPHALSSTVHKLWRTEDMGVPQGRVRSHMSFGRDTNVFDKTVYLEMADRFRFIAPKLIHFLDSFEEAMHDPWLTECYVGGTDPCPGDDTRLKAICDNASPRAPYPPDCEQPLWELQRLCRQSKGPRITTFPQG